MDGITGASKSAKNISSYKNIEALSVVLGIAF